MAKSGTIKFTINDNKNSICSLDLIKGLLSNGWNLNYNGMVSYLPLGDEDFNWCSDKLDEKDKIFHIIQDKIQNQELIGIILTWKNTGIGVDTLFYPSLSILSFGMYINRKCINHVDVTDFTWYLEKMIPTLLNLGLSIEVIECVDG
jgi:hypothetical protein